MSQQVFSLQNGLNYDLLVIRNRGLRNQNLKK